MEDPIEEAERLLDEGDFLPDDGRFDQRSRQTQ